MLDEVKKTADQKMQKSLEVLKVDLAKVRTGRAHTGLLDHVMVEYYGSLVAVNQVANVNLGDSRTINAVSYTHLDVYKRQIKGALNVNTT